MNLVERLIAVDKKEFDKIETLEFPSKRLSALLGEPAKVKIQVIEGDLFAPLSGCGMDKDGNIDYDKLFDTNAKIAAAGIIEPNLKEKALLEHLGVATPADAAKKIFKGEINKISLKIAKLSGFEDEETTDKEIKN